MSGAAFAQPPINDSCKKALTIVSGPQLAYTSTVVTQSAVELPLPTNTGCGNTLSGIGDVWLKFTTTAQYFRVQFESTNGAPLNMVYYRGTCGAFQLIGCENLTMTVGQVHQGVIFNLPVGTEVYLRMFGASRIIAPTTIHRFNVGVVEVNRPGRVVSTLAGGDWSLPTTWLAGRAPTYGDTVIIQDGARVVYNNVLGGMIVHSLDVGQGDSTKHAVLTMRVGQGNNSFPFITLTDMVVNRRDSVRLVPFSSTITANNWTFRLRGTLKVDGALNVSNNGVISFQFDSTGTKQRIFGRGQLTSLVNVRLDNPLGVEIDTRLTFGSNVQLFKGLLDLRRPATLGLTTQNSLRMSRGDVRGTINYVDSINTGIFFDGSIHVSDSSRNIFKYVNPRWPATITISNRAGKYFYGAGNMKIRSLTLNNANPMPTINLRSRDTVFTTDQFTIFGTGNDSQGRPVRPAVGGGILNATICRTLNGVSPTNPSVVDILCLDSLRRTSALRLFLPGSLSTTRYNVFFKSSRASGSALGQCFGTIGRTTGNRLMRISTNRRPLPQGIQLGFFIYPTQDSIKGSSQRWRVVQGLTPRGPWRDVSDDAMPVETLRVGQNLLTDIFVLRLRRDLDITQGEYFTFGIEEVPVDISVRSANVVAIANAGLCGPKKLTLNLQLRNDAVLPSTQIRLGYKLEGPNGYTFSGRDTLDLKPNLGLNTFDTLTLKARNSPVVDGIGSFNITLWLDSTTQNGLLNSFDTIRIPFNNLPRFTAPITISGFDSVPVGKLPYQWSMNSLAKFKTVAQQYYLFNPSPPFLNFKPFAFFTGAARSPGRVENYLYTGPIAMLRGRWEIGMKFNPYNLNGRPDDSCHIEYSTDCGNTYTTLTKFGGSSHTFYSTTVPWTSYPYSVKRIINTSAAGFLHFRFRTVMPQPSTAAALPEYGIYIDSIVLNRIIPTGLSADLAMQALTLAPNPATSEVAIMGLSEELTPYTLINNLGQVVRRGKASASDNKISLQGLPRGLYTVATERDRLRLVVE